MGGPGESREGTRLYSSPSVLRNEAFDVYRGDEECFFEGRGDGGGEETAVEATFAAEFE